MHGAALLSITAYDRLPQNPRGPVGSNRAATFTEQNWSCRLRRAAGVAGAADGLSEQTCFAIGHRLDDERTVEEDVAHLTSRLGDEQSAVAGSAMQGAITIITDTDRHLLPIFA